MKAEICLRRLLKEHGLDHHGIIQEMSDDLKLNRRTIAKLYNGIAPTISLKQLSSICTWLQDHKVPSAELPGGLFCTGRTSMWQDIARQKTTTFYLGEYHQTEVPAAAWRWVARRDVAVVTNFVQQLSIVSENGPSTPEFNFEYVTLRLPLQSYDITKDPLAEDIKRAGIIYEEMKANHSNSSSIIVGSQRVNYLLEYFIGGLFGCSPFMPTVEPRIVPFFFVYREYDHKTPSCFGGLKNPFRRKDSHVPGLHCLERKGRWITYPWVKNKHDAGIIITIYDHKTKSVQIAIFGFSGRATDALGHELILNERIFWPPLVEFKGKEIGVYVCRFDYSQEKSTNSSQVSLKVDSCKVIPLSEKILKEFLR